MRILYLHQYFNTPEVGGGTRSYEFGKRLVKKGHDVELISGPVVGSQFENLKELEVAGMKVNIVGSKYANKMAYRRRIFSFVAYVVFAILRGRKLQKPDVIYATSTPLTVAVPALILSSYFKVPFVFEVRDLWPEAPIQMGALKNPLVIKVTGYLEKLAYERAVHVVALSPGMVEGIKKRGIKSSKISMIPNSSDLELFNADEATSRNISELLDISEDKNLILYAGTVSYANGLEILIPLAKKLQGKRPDIHIVVAGDGTRLKYLVEEKKKWNLDNLTFTGRLDKYKIAGLYRVSAASLVIFRNVPILSTNSPNKFFDSLAAGKPVISNMSGWIKTLLEENNAGIYVEPDDVEELERAIVKLVDDEDGRKTMGENALRLAEEKFNRDLLAEEMEGVLIQAAGKEHGERNQ